MSSLYSNYTQNYSKKDNKNLYSLLRFKGLEKQGATSIYLTIYTTLYYLSIYLSTCFVRLAKVESHPLAVPLTDLLYDVQGPFAQRLVQTFLFRFL